MDHDQARAVGPSKLTFNHLAFHSLEAPILLFCFTDASPKAYAAVIYAKQGNQVSFVFSKAHVAPLKPLLTVPGLDLTAVLIGVHLLKFVERQLKLPVLEHHLWSDSQIALYPDYFKGSEHSLAFREGFRRFSLISH